MEKNIDELLEEKLEIPDQNAMNRKIRSGIARTVYTRVLIALAALAALIAGGVFAVRQYKEMTAYHLDELEDVLSAGIRAKGYSKEQLDSFNAGFYLNGYYEIFTPGYAAVFLSSDTEETDYGTYRFDAYPVNLFRSNPESTWNRRIIRSSSLGRLCIMNGWVVYPDEQQDEFYFNDLYRMWWAFGSAYTGFYDAQDPRTEIESLPDSAYIEIDARLNREMTTEEVLKLQIEYPDSRIVYCITHLFDNEDVNDAYAKHPLGFSMVSGEHFNCPDPYEYNSEKYPYLLLPYDHWLSNYYRSAYVNYLKQEMLVLEQGNDRGKVTPRAEVLETHYHSVLSLLVNNHVLQGQEKELAEAALKDMEENGVHILGLRIICTKEDALRLYDSRLFRLSHINDVKSSRFEN